MAELGDGSDVSSEREEVMTDPGGPLEGITNGLDEDITNRVVDSGSNADGEWVRFADGTQICWKTGVATGGNTQSTAGLYISATDERYTWSFPKSFSSAPVFMGNRNAVSATTVKASCNTSNATVITIEGASNSSERDNIDVCAIGRWK